MKNALYLLTLLTLVACQSGSELDAKKQELAGYRSQLDEITTKIATLEKEIALLDTTAEMKEPKLVSLAPVQNGNFKHYIDLQGTIDSEENIAVQPGMPGLVTKVYVREGDRVTAGQVLAETDSRAIYENIAQMETNIDLAKTAYERQERLWKQKIGSEMQYLQAKTQYEALSKSLSALRIQADMSRIKAPVSGVVDQVNVKVGEFATPGIYGAFRVVNTARMKAVLKVADSYLSKVKSGAPVSIYLKDLNDTIQGNISFVGKAVDALTRTFTVEVRLNNTQNELRPNMLATVSINDENIENAVSVPTNLIQKDASGNAYLLVAEGAGDKMTARKRLVKTGLNYGDRTVITSGLAATDKLITSGFREVVDGQPVKTL